MAYSNKKVPNDPTIFPTPQTWMTWVEDRSWISLPGGGWGPNPSDIGEGKLRHYHTLADAKKGLSWIASASSYRAEDERGTFQVNWAVYQWDDAGQEWKKVYEGLAGEPRSENPLFQRRFKKGEKVNPIDANLESRAVESILNSARRAS